MWTTEAIAASNGSWDRACQLISSGNHSPERRPGHLQVSGFTVAQTTAASAEEGAAASEEMNSQAETMRGVVQVLQQMVGQ